MNHRTLLPFLLLLPLLAACKPSRSAKGTADVPALTVSIEPLRYFTEALAGPYFTVSSLVPGGMSPETYDPTPRQLVELSGSVACLLTGHLGFEQVWHERLQSAAPDVAFVDLSEGLPLIHEEEGHGHEGHHHHSGGIEPHIWNSPANASLIATHILQTLCRLDPEHRSYFEARHDSLQTCIHRVDSLTRQWLQRPEARHAFLIYHPALSYYARDYGLRQVAIEEEGKEPTPEALRRLIDLCRSEQIGVIFVQPEFDTRHAELIARQTGTRIVRINPLAYQWDEEMLRVARELAGEAQPL